MRNETIHSPSKKDLVQRALQGFPVPRVPVGPLAVHFCTRLTGCTLRQYSTDARLMAEAVVRYYERFRPDAIWLSADTWISAEAMGARVGAQSDDQPLGGLEGPAIRTIQDIDRIPPPDASSQGRYPMMLEALSRTLTAVGKEAWVVACMDQYPFSLAAALMGINEIMVKVLDDPPFVEALMERCVEYQLAYGKALAAAGADMLSGGDSPAGLLGPALYSSLALPFEKRVIQGLQASTHKPVSLHICGNTVQMLGAMATSGADCLEIDHWVDLAEGCQRIGPGIGLWGNLDPVGVLSRGSPESVQRAARRAVYAAKSCGHHRFILSSGCTLAMETPFENLEALVQAGRY